MRIGDNDRQYNIYNVYTNGYDFFQTQSIKFVLTWSYIVQLIILLDRSLLRKQNKQLRDIYIHYMRKIRIHGAKNDSECC